MKLALIAPTPNLNNFERMGDKCFVLAHRWYDDDEYRKYYISQTRPVIIDNSAYEHKKPYGAQQLLKIAQRLKSDDVTIVLPDAYKNSKATRILFLQCVDQLRRTKFKLMVVPQGPNAEAYIREYVFFSKIIAVDVIAFPIWLDKEYSRVEVVTRLKKQQLFSTHHQHHLLGLDNPNELRKYSNDDIQSVDTSLPFSYAAIGAKLKNYPVEHTRVRENNKFTSDQYPLVRENIEFLKRLANK